MKGKRSGKSALLAVVVGLCLMICAMGQPAWSEDKVVKLGPLDARSRRIVHIELREMDGVTTRSEGEGVFRRVCIIPRSQKKG